MKDMEYSVISRLKDVDKIRKVINSCETEDQFETAKKMVELFSLKHGESEHLTKVLFNQGYLRGYIEGVRNLKLNKL